MQESTLLRFSFIVALIGLFSLYILANSIEPPESPLLKKDNLYRVQGSIARITEREAVTFITLNKEEELTVVLFKKYPVDLHQGEYIEVVGKASESPNGEMQLIGNEVRVIK